MSVSVPIVAGVALLFGILVAGNHIHHTFKAFKQRRLDVENRKRQSDEVELKTDKIILILSNLSIVFALSIPICIILTYTHPLSKTHCDVYWKVLVIMYTVILYFLKWTFFARSYNVLHKEAPSGNWLTFIKCHCVLHVPGVISVIVLCILQLHTTP
eukprot:360667_1